MEGKTIDQKIDKLDANVNRLEVKVDVIDRQVGTLETNVHRLEKKVDVIDRRVENVERDVAEIKRTMGTKEDVGRLESTQNRMLIMLTNHDGDIKDIKGRLDRVETKLEMFDVLMIGQDKMIGLLQKIDQEMTMRQLRFERIEARIGM